MILLLWSLFGIASGIIFGIIPGAGPFLAIATVYAILANTEPINILAFYIALIITSNYTNSVTAILYGIPGDATAVTTARIGHKLFTKGVGHLAVSSNAIASSIGSIFAVGVFLLFFPQILHIFKFYNSTIQLIVIGLAIILITLYTKQQIYKTLLLFILGGVLAKIGFNNTTYETWGTFGIDYLTLGIPFSSIMIGLYIIPEILKFKNLTISTPKKITKFAIGKNTLPATMLGSVVGFWCGLIPGITNILGSFVSANLVKKFFRMPNLKSISAAEAANNSGALSSLLPLLILGIPIVGSEVLIYYLMMSQGYIFNLETIKSEFFSILYCIPVIILICLLLSWTGFNMLGKIAYLYKEHKNIVSIGIVSIICIMSIQIYPVAEWMLICLIVLTILGYYMRNLDTFPVIYGFFLTDLFWDNAMRVVVIHDLF